MINWLIWVVLGALLIASFLDIKYKQVPSVFLTGLLFLVAVMRIDNLQFGILALIFAWLMKDLIFETNGLDFGMADIKIFGILGLLVSTMNMFLIMIGIFAIFQLAYTLLWKWKVNKDEEMPFIPVLAFVFIAMVFVGGIF